MPRAFTDRQRQYIDAIVAAELAGVTEVEAAFRSRTEEAQNQINTWGRVLRERRNAEQKEQQEAYLQSLAHTEPCAYPGCTNTIEIRAYRESWGIRMSAKPVRWVELKTQLEGWHYQGVFREENTETTKIYLYACSENHKEGVYRLKFSIVPIIDEEAEKRIEDAKYPVAGSQVAWWKVWDMARKNATEDLENGKIDKHKRATIKPLAEKSLQSIIDEHGDSTQPLADDMEQFRELYVTEYTEGCMEALRVQKRIKRKDGFNG